MKNLLLVGLVSLALSSSAFAEHHKGHPMKAKTETSCDGKNDREGKDCKKKDCDCKSGADCKKKGHNKHKV